MSAFEFVFGLITIISSLALTHLATTLVGLIRNSERIRFSVTHGAFMWAAFATTVANWGSSWGLQQVPAWPAWLVLLSLTTVLAQYLFCALVSPEIGQEKIDLREWEEKSRKRFLVPLIALIVLAIIQNVGCREYYRSWWSDSLWSIGYGAIASVCFIKHRNVRCIAAIALAVTATMFMIMACTIVPLAHS